MDWLVPATAALVAAAILIVLLRSLARRDLAEAHVAMAGELASAQTLAQDAQRRLRDLEIDVTERHEQIAMLRAENASLKQDNRWLADEATRQTPETDD